MPAKLPALEKQGSEAYTPAEQTWDQEQQGQQEQHAAAAVAVAQARHSRALHEAGAEPRPFQRPAKEQLHAQQQAAYYYLRFAAAEEAGAQSLRHVLEHSWK
jgi:hypothetical protein